MFYCKLFIENKEEIRFDYLFNESTDNEKEDIVHIFSTEHSINLENYTGKILIVGYWSEDRNGIFKLEIDVSNLSLVNKSKFSLIGLVKYSNDYYYYDQLIVDLLYQWGDLNFAYEKMIKKTYLYNFVTMLTSGVPKITKLNSPVVIEGDCILNEYHFYNELAELFLGKGAYFASSPAGLYDTLRRNREYLEIHKPTLIIKNYKVLEEVLKIQHTNDIKDGVVFKQGKLYESGFLFSIIGLLKDYHFNVITD